jgi:hypothetical protein
MRLTGMVALADLNFFSALLNVRVARVDLCRFLINATEPATGIRVQWAHTHDQDESEDEACGPTAYFTSGNTPELLDSRALMINFERVCSHAEPHCCMQAVQPLNLRRAHMQGRISAIVIKKSTVSSLWELLFFWKCEIELQQVQVTLRRPRLSSPTAKSWTTRLASSLLRRQLQQPWLWCATAKAQSAIHTVLWQSTHSLQPVCGQHWHSPYRR